MAFIEPMHRNKPNITYLLTAHPAAFGSAVQLHRSTKKMDKKFDAGECDKLPGMTDHLYNASPRQT